MHGPFLKQDRRSGGDTNPAALALAGSRGLRNDDWVAYLNKMLLGSRLVPARSDDWIAVQSPFTEEVIGHVPVASEAELDDAVAQARRAFDEGPWPHLPVAERAGHLSRITDSLSGELANMITCQIDEMGGTQRFIAAATTASTSTGYLDRERENAETALRSDVRATPAGHVLVFREPTGVNVDIVPWNTPVPAVMVKIIPALLAGCPAIVKTSPLSPLSATYLIEAIANAELPAGLISLVHGGAEVGRYLAAHPGVDHVAFTGSTPVGRELGRTCGEQLKSVTLELGGKSAAVVLDDADLDITIPNVVKTSVPNTGQVCWATTRILAPRHRYADVVDALSSAFAQLTIGDPQDPDTDIGPLVSSRQRDRVETHIAAAKQAGAVAVTGGGRPRQFGRGWFVEPTVFSEVDNSMTVAREEIFGPVVCVIPYTDDSEAVAIANDSPYGLGGAVHSADPVHALAVASKIRTGTCAVNDGAPGGGGGPFGGYKMSGVGRERSTEAYQWLTQVRSVSFPANGVPAGDLADLARELQRG
jgi:betaine-aldehyde dehydrogenase